MFLPLTAAQWAMSNSNQQSDLLISLNDWKSLPYNLLFFILIVIFTYVYTALIVNPQQYAEYLKRSNAFIPGVKPGQDTQDYIDTLTTRITLPGAIFIGVIAILPAFVALAGVNDAFAIFLRNFFVDSCWCRFGYLTTGRKLFINEKIRWFG